MWYNTAFQMTNYAMTPLAVTRKSVPKNGQAQLRAHARAAFAF
jgi:hypothetical protein